MSFTEIREFLKHMQSEDNLKTEVTSSATADDAVSYTHLTLPTNREV